MIHESSSYENRFARIESDLTLLKWMVGLILALQVARSWKMFGT